MLDAVGMHLGVKQSFENGTALTGEVKNADGAERSGRSEGGENEKVVNTANN